MKKLTLNDLEKNDSWEEAVIVFTQDSFSKEFTETERSYEISRSCKYFDPMMIGNSLYGDCLDGTDNGVRLDRYMSGEKGWEVEFCYITK